MVQMEADLDRAVLVRVGGRRDAVTAAVAAAAIFDRLGLQVDVDFSIRPAEPADFLILCGEVETRDILLREQFVSAPVTLHFEPWSRRAGATQREMPFLAELVLRGIPAHAWAERTAIKLLEGSGFIDAVDPDTAARRDMKHFRLSLWTHDLASIPTLRWLAVPEPVPEPGSGLPLRVSTGQRRPRISPPQMLWYRISIDIERWLLAGSPPASDGSDAAEDAPSLPATVVRLVVVVVLWAGLTWVVPRLLVVGVAVVAGVRGGVVAVVRHR
jgi:hypothetical protein